MKDQNGEEALSTARHSSERTAQAYYVEHQDEIRPRNREYKREVRGTDPAKFVENRDPEAIKARARERWRRGQANRRARLREVRP